MIKLSFKPNIATKKLLLSLKDRTRDIISQRYGLDDAEERKTLEAIGRQYGITRERVRQIENFALNSIKKNPVFESLNDVFSELKNIIDDKGKIISEKEILDYLAPDPNLKNHIIFLLVLGDDFIKLREDDEFCHCWTIDKDMADKVHEVLRQLHQEISEDDLIPEEEIAAFFRKKAKDIIKEEIREEIIRSWLNISKIILKNAFGEWGPVSSPYIKPRGMRDFAFLVLKKHGSPLHFSEVCGKINEIFSRPAHSATVHNELIKDPRFVLVGRGLYALDEWGYKVGTVKDIIKDSIKARGPLTKEEIIKNVLKERHVKENTILVNLQNRKYFKKNKEGKYVFA
ncbi:MAG: hypothetical protein HY773_00260 [Candidatus Terrybacteria bacterium]|nr:hypothetical protein [Candidatus Terrybacteria bacterium]